MITPKFNIGDSVFWVYSSTNHGKRVPCEMCFGQKFVTIILGDGSQQPTECGACQAGIDPPSGVQKIWEPIAEVRSGKISGIESDRGTWRYKCGVDNLEEDEIFTEAAQADALRVTRFAEETARAAQFRKDNLVRCKQAQVWSAQYHRRQIKEHEQKIEWHRYRLAMCKQTLERKEAEK